MCTTIINRYIYYEEKFGNNDELKEKNFNNQYAIHHRKIFYILG